MTSSPLRVAIANWGSRRVGGIEEYLSILIPALRGAGHEIAFWYETDAPADRGRIDVPPGVTEICAETLGVDSAIAALRDWKPDVIYAHGLVDADVERRLQAIAPAILFLHTYSGTCISGGKTFTRPTAIACDRTFGWPCLAHYFPHGCGGRSPITMWQQFQIQSNRLAVMRGYRAVLTHTTHMRAEMARHGVAADVVPYPVEARSADAPAPRDRDAELRLLFAGRMDFLKGGRFLVDALPTVAAAIGRPVTATFAGDGQQRQALEARAHEIESTAVSTTFVGWVMQDRIATLMAASDLLVVPSVWPEPFGSVGPAAAQHGVPAAAFDVGGIREWLADGVSGHLADARPPTSAGLAAAIVRCVESAGHYAALREGARKMAQRFTMARHLPELTSALEQAAGRTPARVRSA